MSSVGSVGIIGNASFSNRAPPKPNFNRISTSVPRPRRRCKSDYELRLPCSLHKSSMNLSKTSRWLSVEVLPQAQAQAGFPGGWIDSSEGESSSHDPASTKVLLPGLRAVRLVASGSDSDQRAGKSQVNDRVHILIMGNGGDAYDAASPQPIGWWRRRWDRNLFIFFNRVTVVKAELFVPGKNHPDRLTRSRDCSRSALVH